MLARFWSIILILICVGNSASLGNSYGLQNDAVGNVTESALVVQDKVQGQIQERIQEGDGIEVHSLSGLDLEYGTHRQGDCDGDHNRCEHCHLGHCQFLVISAPSLSQPLWQSTLQEPLNQSHREVALSHPLKPPRFSI